MEARACEEDLNCAVCHQVYRDPITLTCRHSFCLKCIEDVWPQVSDQNGFRCPCCHRKFNPEPSLEGSTPTVTCDHCGESQSPALKTCLKCETSFCPLHLKPHLTKDIFKDHELVDPPTDLTRRKCPDHKKILEYFCEDDGVCVCSSCGLTGNHRSHKIVNLDEAQDARKKKLKSEVGKLQRVQQNCSIKDKDLEKSEAELKTITSELKGKLLQKFSERRKQLDKDEEYVLRMIDKEEHCRLSAIQGCSKTLQSMVEQLNLTKEEAQNLMEKDCISFIQNSEALTSKVIECQKIKYPDTPELALNLSNVSQLAKKKMEEMKQYDLAIVQVIGSYDRSVGRKESAGTTPPQRKLASPPPPQTTPSSMGSILKDTISSEPQATSLNDTTTELRGCFPSQLSYSVTVAHQSDRPTETRSKSSTRERLVQQMAEASSSESKQNTCALERLSRVSKDAPKPAEG